MKDLFGPKWAKNTLGLFGPPILRSAGQSVPLVGWLVGWFGWLVGWLGWFGWLVGWLGWFGWFGWFGVVG